jgi:hypothetical protein
MGVLIFGSGRQEIVAVPHGLDENIDRYNATDMAPANASCDLESSGPSLVVV